MGAHDISDTDGVEDPGGAEEVDGVEEAEAVKVGLEVGDGVEADRRASVVLDFDGSRGDDGSSGRKAC